MAQVQSMEENGGVEPRSTLGVPTVFRAVSFPKETTLANQGLPPTPLAYTWHNADWF